MAMQLNAGEVTRQNLFIIDPQHILWDEADNSRKIPHNDEQIACLAESIRRHGQEQPILCRKVEDKKVRLVAGFGRLKAVLHLNASLENGAEPFRLKCSVVECNQEEAFIKGLVENLDRCETTPVDDAHAQRRLREDFGWPEAKIAEFYRCTVSALSQTRKLLQLDAPIQEKIANGSISVSAAVQLTELPEAERSEAVAAATDPVSGKVNSGKIRQKVRDKKAESGNGHVGRTSKEVKSFFEGLTGPAERESIADLAEKFLAFAAGKITEKEMQNALEKNCK